MKGRSVNPGNERPSSSTSLVAKLKAQDADAWRRLATVYGPLVYGWCRRRGLQESDAADVVQEVFRTVARGIADYKADSFRGWLWTIARSRLIDFVRRRDRQPQAAGGTDAQGKLREVAEVLDESSAAPEIGGAVRRALESIQPEFKDKSWQAFWRVVMEEKHPVDVAADLGMSVNAVYIAKARILSRLRDELGECGT